MPVSIDSPKYVYADILIALAQADGYIDPRERKLLDGIFHEMELDEEKVEEMWLTPCTLDVVEAKLADIPDGTFKNCLVKDAYLVAFADTKVVNEESTFIRTLCTAMNVSNDRRDAIKAWVETALTQKETAEILFGA